MEREYSHYDPTTWDSRVMGHYRVYKPHYPYPYLPDLDWTRYGRLVHGKPGRPDIFNFNSDRMNDYTTADCANNLGSLNAAIGARRPQKSEPCPMPPDMQKGRPHGSVYDGFRLLLARYMELESQVHRTESRTHNVLQLLHRVDAGEARAHGDQPMNGQKPASPEERSQKIMVALQEEGLLAALGYLQEEYNELTGRLYQASNQQDRLLANITEMFVGEVD